MNPEIYRILSQIYFHPRTFPGWTCFITISPSFTTSSSANTSFPTSPSPDPSSHLLSFDTDPLITTISGIGAPSIREPGYRRPESLYHIFEAANLSLSLSLTEQTSHCSRFLDTSQYHNSICQYHQKKVCINIPKLYLLSFFSNSPTKQLLLLLILGLKHDVLTPKGNFAKQAELNYRHQ